MESIGKESLVISVCPISRYGNYFVTASGLANKENENLIRIYKFDPQTPEDPLRILSQIKVTVAFTTIGWTKYGEESEEHKFGFIVGGHQDGSVSLWEATAMIAAKENKKLNMGLLQSKKFHSSSVNAVKFNQKSSLFASGSKDIVIISIEKNLTMESPVKCPSQDDAEITSLNWNDKVSHILAAATTTGTTYIWEMKKTEVCLRITDQNLLLEDSEEIKREGLKTKVLWCNDGVQIIIAYDHPEYTFLTQYHMKQPNAPMAEYYGGHRDAITDIVKNPNDTNFILSLGKDDTVTCWSLRSQKHVAQISLQEKSSSIVWLNKTPDVFLSVSFEGALTFHQVNFSADNSSEFPPKWLNKKSGVSFAFGGKFATFNEKNVSNISIHALSGNQSLSSKMKSFIEKVEKSDLTEVLNEKINSSLSNPSNREKHAILFWVALKCLFSKDYSELFKVMGFDKTKLQNEVYSYIGKKVEKAQKKERQKISNINIVNDEKEAENFWNDAVTKSEKPESDDKHFGKINEANIVHEKPLTIQETITKNINWNLGAEKLIKQSLLIGDLESAVDIALKCGRDAEALLIASAGDKELFNKAKQSFFNKNKDLFIKNIFSSIVNGNFESLFEYNVLKDWKEYILYAKTYQEGNQFLTFANSLGDRLSSNPDIYMALVCYVLAQNYEKCVELLYANYLKETEKVNKEEKKIYLQNLFEALISLKNVLGYNHSHEKTDKIISEYCELLISEGLFVEACTYLTKVKNSNCRMLTLYDRLYNHCDHKLGHKFAKLQSPFNVVIVKAKIEKKVEKTKVGGGVVSNKLPQTNKDIFDMKESNTGSNKKPFSGNDSLMDKPKMNADMNSGEAKQGNRILPKPSPFRNINNPNVDEQRASIDNNNNKSESGNSISTTSNTELKKVARPIVPMKPVNPPMPMNFKRSSQDVEETPNPVPRTFNPVSNMQNPAVGPVNPPKPIFNPNNQPKNPTPFHNKTESQNKLSSPVSSGSSQNNSNVQPMTQEETLIHNSFEQFINDYNGVYLDENKQKDFSNRVAALLTKLKNHEIKPNLLNLLIEFIKLYQTDVSTGDLKKMQLKIQANGWDQNKTWMSCIEKIVNMPKNK